MYLASHSRLALFEKAVAFAALPRLGEFVKLCNREQGDYFAFSVVQVTHREGGRPEVWLNLITVVGGESVIDFFEDAELDEYIAGYTQEGWVLASLKPNRTVRGDGKLVWPKSSDQVEPTT